MRVTFYGAAGEVTGSCNLLETSKHKILVDCGMFQGSHFNEEKNHAPLAFNPADLSTVIVTHAHLDHVGRLPLLIRGGYEGIFYATPATIELAKIIMEDALHVMQENSRKYGTPVLYEDTDIAGVVQRFRPVEYYHETVLSFDGEEVKFKFFDAGHIFGSAFVEIQAEGKRIVFSGDVGNANLPIVRDTDALPENLDLLVCESTYGDRLHESTIFRRSLLEGVVIEAMQRGGVLMIPAFSLERTQELLYDFNDLIERRKLLPPVPLFLDSPLAIHAIPTYKKYTAYYEDARALLSEGDDFFAFPGFTITEKKEQSVMINGVPNPKIIIAGSGMMNGGRIQHHAMRYLSDDKSTLLIIGYQAQGTIGRQILDGAKEVDIFRQKIPVRCAVKAIGTLSAHADQQKLADWIKVLKSKPKKIIFNHGEKEAASVLAQKISSEMGVVAMVPEENMSLEF